MSIKRIAQLAGTSPATVSRVLNHPEHKCNDAELQKRIWEIAGQLQYTPNTTARELRLGKGHEEKPFMIDVFLTRFFAIENDAFFMEMFQMIKEELVANGCVFGELLTNKDILNLGHEQKEKKHIPYKSDQTVLSESIQNTSAFVGTKKDTGLIILGKCPEELIAFLRRRYVYMVGIDRNPTEHLYDEIFCDGAAATKMAVEYLISLGHRQIAYVGDCNYESRYIGYYQTLLQHKLPLSYDNVYPTEQTEAEGYQVMTKIMEKKQRPTAIFCANDTTALGVLAALRKSRRKEYKPSVISIDDIKAASHTKPMLTTIAIPKREMVHLALMMLLDRRKEGHTENLHIEFPCHLIRRESCYPVHGLC